MKKRVVWWRRARARRRKTRDSKQPAEWDDIAEQARARPQKRGADQREKVVPSLLALANAKLTYLRRG